MSNEANLTEHHLVDLIWEGDLDAYGPRSSRQPLRYTAYVPGPVAERSWSLPSDLAALLTQAEQACTRLEAEADRVGLDTVARQLLRTDAVASSRIEGLVLSNRRLAKALASGSSDLTAQSVLRNVAAVEHAYAFALKPQPFTTETLTGIHRELFEGTPSASLGGSLRTSQNWIGGGNTSPIRAEFVPPPASEVLALTDDLAAFCNRTDLPPLLQAAIAHSHFETIHPFADGNGRTGRALVGMILIRRGVCIRVVPPVSLVLAANSDSYIAGLTSWRFGNPLDWIEFFARAVSEAARAMESLGRNIHDLQEQWALSAGQPRQGSAARMLIDALPTVPVLSLSTACEVTGLSDEACRRALNRLADAGVLNETTAGKRYRVWEAAGLFGLLDQIERGVDGDR